MALKFKNQTGSAAKSQDGETKAAPKGSGGKFPSWMKTGKAAAAALEEERLAAEQRQLDNKKMWRFWVNAGDSATIVFLDGELTKSGPEEGRIENPLFREHTVKHKGNWHNIVCAEMSGEACPLCEAEDNASLVSVFTVIDTRKIKGKNKTYENEPKLFVAKQRTLATLQKIAEKQGGLRGCVIETTRTDDRSARVGDTLLFEGKMDESELVDNFGEEHVAPADYSKEITLRTADEINALLQGTLEQSSSVGGEGVGSTPGNDDVPF